MGGGGDVNVTDTTFSGNSAGVSGGAISMVSGQLTFTTNIPITLDPSSGKNTGDNDIAGGSSVSFIKAGDADLVLNTKNSGWMGPTTVNAGRMIVGDSAHTGASWGSAGVGDITVQQGATLGGFGTVNGNNITFESESTWVAGIMPNGQNGQLNSSDTLTLRSGVSLAVTPSSGAYDGPDRMYKIATYRTLNKEGDMTVSVDSTAGLQGFSEVTLLMDPPI